MSDRATRPHRAAPAEGRTLVCIVGNLDALDVTAERLVERVVEPLDADTLVCGSASQDGSPLPELDGSPVVETVVYPHDAPTPLQSGAPADLAPYRAIDGDWLGGWDSREGTGLPRMLNLALLHERVRALEASGTRYARFVITRADLLWLYWHPPGDLLDPRYLWIPTGLEAGYPDQHAVCSRSHLDRYLGAYAELADRVAKRYVKDRRSLTRQDHLKLMLDFHGVRIGRFANVAYRRGSSSWTAVRARAASGATRVYRYESERHQAVLNAELLRRGKSWRSLVRRGTETTRLLRRLTSRLRRR